MEGLILEKGRLMEVEGWFIVEKGRWMKYGRDRGGGAKEMTSNIKPE